jgi:hypothetical protein
MREDLGMIALQDRIQDYRNKWRQNFGRMEEIR